MRIPKFVETTRAQWPCRARSASLDPCEHSVGAFGRARIAARKGDRRAGAGGRAGGQASVAGHVQGCAEWPAAVVPRWLGRAVEQHVQHRTSVPVIAVRVTWRPDADISPSEVVPVGCAGRIMFARVRRRRASSSQIADSA